MKTIFLASTFVLCVCVACSGGSGGAGTTGSDTGTSVNSAGSSQTPPANSKTATNAPAGQPAKGDYAKVQAVFTNNCASCHGGAHPKHGIDLTSYDTAMKGGTEGPVITPGDPDNSVLAKAIQHLPGAKSMPPKGKLSDSDIALIVAWIKAGAKNG